MTIARSVWCTITSPARIRRRGWHAGARTYGGRINTVAPDETASGQRSAILDIACTTAGWIPRRGEESDLGRSFYRELLQRAGRPRPRRCV